MVSDDKELVGLQPDVLCAKCGKHKAYMRKGRIYKLCASCGIFTLKEFIGGEQSLGEENEIGDE